MKRVGLERTFEMTNPGPQSYLNFNDKIILKEQRQYL